MLLVTHTVVGATIVKGIKNPFFSLPLAFFSHFLMDLVPHWDLGINYRKYPRKITFILALVDGLMSLGLVFFLYQYKQPFSPFLWHSVGVSVLPDLIEVPYVFFGLHIFPKLDYIHSKIFHRKNMSVFWGLLPQIILIGACVWLGANFL